MFDKIGSSKDVSNGELHPETIPNTIRVTTKREFLPQTASKISSTLPQNEVNISEEVRKNGIKVLSTEQCNIPCVHNSLMDLNLKNMVLISTQQNQVFFRDGLVSMHKDYWSTIKLTGLQPFRKSSIDDTIPDTELVNHVSTGMSELHETGSMDNNCAKTTNESKKQNINIANNVKNNTETESLIRKYTKWLTTSAGGKNRETGSDSDEEGSNTRKTIYNLTTAKTVNINYRDINVIAPSSF